MAINNFKPFALDPNANVTSQADWEALPALLSGFTAGKASSAQVNKAIRQASFIAAALAQYTANKSGLDVLDDGDLNGFISKMGTAFGKDFQALDATLSALAGLATGANKLPYFTGNDTAAQTDLTSVGRDIIGKSTIADVLTYLTAAPLASPSFTGTPTVPNAPAGTNTTQSANTAFVTAALTAFLPKRSFANKDYIRIPDVAGGLIIQWGLESVPPSSSTVFSLPTTFPNSGLVAVASAADSTTTTNYRASVGSVSPFPTASQIRLTNTFPNNAINVFYIAIGY